MGRNPRARDLVLDAAERLVKNQGAACLTFERLAEESGVTRGGITYHFPTKLELLRALVARDVVQWRELRESLRPDDVDCAAVADTVSRIRSCGLTRDGGHQRLVAGLVAAAAHEPALADPVRDVHAERHADRTWDERDLRLYLLEMAADGIFWTDLFDLYRLPEAARTRLLELMERLAREWGSAGADRPQKD